MEFPRYIEDDDCPKLLCKICKEYYPFEDYYPCKQCNHGKMTTCKYCYKEKQYEGRGKPISDKDTVNEWLRRMGYEIGGEKTIHEQFLERMEQKNANRPPQEPKPPKKKIKDMTREEYNEYQKQIKLKKLKKDRK